MLRNVRPPSNSIIFHTAGGASSRASNVPPTPTDDSPKRIDAWSAADVCDWLEGLDYGEYREKFAASNVTGRRLAGLGQKDFAELGVGSILHQVKLEREVKKIVKNGGLVVV